MNILSNPRWINKFRFSYKTVNEVPISLFNSINKKLQILQRKEPLVSIVIAAWNEEINIISCIASLADTTSVLPIEIVIVNNNSTDNTQLTINQLDVRSAFQPIQGCGPARQLGQEVAHGKFILLADADCIYPKAWIDEMVHQLRMPGVVCVYGRYSFISEKGYARWQLYLLEKMKDVIAAVRHYKRPYLNAYGISMGYVREYGLRAGYVMRNVRGEDGRLCFDLMQYGQINQVKVKQARPWTGLRTLQQDGSFGKALLTRIWKEACRLFSMLTAHTPHDTKTSLND